MTETTDAARQGDKNNIPEELHREAEELARKLMQMPPDPRNGKKTDRD